MTEVLSVKVASRHDPVAVTADQSRCLEPVDEGLAVAAFGLNHAVERMISSGFLQPQEVTEMVAEGTGIIGGAGEKVLRADRRRGACGQVERPREIRVPWSVRKPADVVVAQGLGVLFSLATCSSLKSSAPGPRPR